MDVCHLLLTTSCPSLLSRRARLELVYGWKKRRRKEIPKFAIHKTPSWCLFLRQCPLLTRLHVLLHASPSSCHITPWLPCHPTSKTPSRSSPSGFSLSSFIFPSERFPHHRYNCHRPHVWGSHSESTRWGNRGGSRGWRGRLWWRRWRCCVSLLRVGVCVRVCVGVEGFLFFFEVWCQVVVDSVDRWLVLWAVEMG